MAKIKKEGWKSKSSPLLRGVSVNVVDADILSGGAQHLDGKLRKTEKKAFHWVLLRYSVNVNAVAASILSIFLEDVETAARWHLGIDGEATDSPLVWERKKTNKGQLANEGFNSNEGN